MAAGAHMCVVNTTEAWRCFVESLVLVNGNMLLLEMPSIHMCLGGAGKPGSRAAQTGILVCLLLACCYLHAHVCVAEVRKPWLNSLKV